MKIIDVFICKLRKKLAQAGAGNLIGTVWGRGYMMREPEQPGRPFRRRHERAGKHDRRRLNTASPSIEAGAKNRVLRSRARPEWP